jgi:hypothetical protein
MAFTKRLDDSSRTGLKPRADLTLKSLPTRDELNQFILTDYRLRIEGVNYLILVGSRGITCYKSTEVE